MQSRRVKGQRSMDFIVWKCHFTQLQLGLSMVMKFGEVWLKIKQFGR